MYTARADMPVLQNAWLLLSGVVLLVFQLPELPQHHYANNQSYQREDRDG